MIFGNYFSRERKFGASSYSQCGEDQIANFYLSCLGITKGSYLDIGAHDPHWLSNTHFFYKKGWRGVNIDPQASSFELFKKYRPQDLNFNFAVSKLGGPATLWILDANSLATASSERANIYVEMGHKVVAKQEIQTVGVRDLSRMLNTTVIDLMSIDVEGLEKDVLEGLFDIDVYPTVLICETAFYAPLLQKAKKDVELIEWIIGRGYEVFADTFMNTIFVQKDWRKRQT